MTTPSGYAVAAAAWDELLSEANARFRGSRGVDTNVLLGENVGKLVGMPYLDDASPRILATVRDGRIAIVQRGFPLQSTDRYMAGYRPSSSYQWEDLLYRDVVALASWLAVSPWGRVVCAHTDVGYGLGIVALNVCLDIRRCRALRGSDSAVSSDLLHDVLATLHGRDRRLAGLVCKGWAAAACDALLPVDKSDAAAWVAPRMAELQGALTQLHLVPHDVVVAWAWTRHWLGGGE
jgi:hypothetical protein